MPTVFISHSCKDGEKAPPAGLSAQEAAARATRLAFARKLRDTLLAKLKKGKIGTPFLDKRDLAAGDVWQDCLHSELSTCAAAVVLLTPESIASGWVLKEATILSWRVFQRNDVLLVPVVLGVTDDDLKARGFSPLAQERIQWVKVDGAGDAAIAKAVAQIVAALKKMPESDLAADRVLSPTDLWIQKFAEHLRSATTTQSKALTNSYLASMCRALEIRPADRKRFADPHLNLATETLLASQDQVVDLLKEAGDPDPSLKERLRKAVAPLWVDPVPASRLAAGGGRVVAIDAEAIASVRDYVYRAFCNKIDPDHVVQPSDVTDGTDAGVIAAIETELGRCFAMDDASLEREIARRGPIFVILGPGSVRPKVLDTVTARYPRLTFVTAAGSSPDVRLGSWWDPARLLYPLLQPARETAAEQYRNKLQKYVNG